MNSDQTVKSREITRRGGKRIRRGAALVVLALLVVVIVGCGRQVPPYWPDLGVSGQVVYVAESNGQLYALAAETGNVMWVYPVVEQRSGGLLGGCSAPVASDGPFFAAPAIGDEVIYLASAGEHVQSLFRRGENLSGLRALNPNGVLQWSFKGTTDRAVASPTLVGSIIYLAADNSVYAIDTSSQMGRWVFETGSWVWAAPVVVENTIFIASMDHNLYAVSTEDGSERWRFTEATGALPAAPVYNDGVLYFGSLDGRMYAVQASDGTPVWEQSVQGAIWATPRVEQGTVYFGTLQGQIYALDAADGREQWRQEVPGEVRGTPAFVNDVLYFGCENGSLYAFNAQEGQAVMTPLSQPIEGASIYTSPVFDGERLYVVATTGQVFALDTEQNAILWQTNPLNQGQEE